MNKRAAPAPVWVLAAGLGGQQIVDRFQGGGEGAHHRRGVDVVQQGLPGFEGW
jgi:hypothetical protein